MRMTRTSCSAGEFFNGLLETDELQARESKMKHLSLLIVTLILAQCCTTAIASNDEIGVFFDQGGTATCITDSLFAPVTAYIIVRHCSSTSGIAGWEALLTWDEGLSVSLQQLSGAAVNVAAFPEFNVGIGQNALPRQDVMVLATLSVFATCPGGLYLSQAPSPSIDGATTPLYAQGNSPDHLIPTIVVRSSANGPSAEIGEWACAPGTVPPGQDVAVGSYSATHIEVPTDPTTAAVTVPTDASLMPATISDAERLYGDVDLAFRGLLLTCQLQSRITRIGVPVGIAVTTFRVSDAFWGVTTDASVQVIILGVDVPQYIAYLPPQQPNLSLPIVGSEYLICGNYFHGRIVAGPYCIISEASKRRSFTSDTQSDYDVESILRSLSSVRTPDSAFAEADLIAEVMPIDRPDNTRLSEWQCKIVQSFRGRPASSIVVDFASRNSSTNGLHPSRHHTYLICAKADGVGRYRVIRGRFGAFRVDGQVLYNNHGMPAVDAMQLLEREKR